MVGKKTYGLLKRYIGLVKLILVSRVISQRQ